MAKKKRRTPAQIRATKKLVRLAKARAHKNTRTRKPSVSRRRPAQSNAGGGEWFYSKDAAKKIMREERDRGENWKYRLVRSKGEPHAGGSWWVLYRTRKRQKNRCNPRRKSQPKVTLAQAKRLYQLGRRSPKTAVAIKRRGSKVSIVTGKAARKLARRS